MSAIQFSVKGQEIYSYSNQLPLVADLSIGFVKVKFNFSSDWSDLEKVAQFTQGSTTYNQVLINDECIIPNEIQAGEFFISVFGTDSSGIRGTTALIKMSMLKSGFTSSSQDPIPPTPDLYAQLLDNIHKAEQSVEENAEQVKKDREVVEEVSITPPNIGTNGNWYVFVDGTYTDSGVPATGPQGLKGDKGEKGEKGLKGDKGDKGEQGPHGESATIEITETQTVEADAPAVFEELANSTAQARKYRVKVPKGAQGPQGEQGPQGADGKDGTSATHSWNGTVLTITSASGTSSADLKGEKGDKGDTGAQGIPGEKGDKGDTGLAGYTPVKGTDYWTDTDKEEIAEEASKMVVVPEIVQATGDSESAVMSQKSVTDALNGYAIPDYWQDYLDSKCATIKTLQDAGGKDCFSFVVMADLHYPSNLGKRSPDLAKKILEDCDIKFALCLGDVQTRGCHATKELLLAENVKIEEMLKPIRKSLLQTQGNHDGNYGFLDRDGNGEYNNTDPDTGEIKPANERESYVYSLTPSELYGYIYRKVGMVGDIHFDESGTGYWIDDVSNKVRYIILNTQNTKYELQEDGTAKYPPMWIFRFQQSQFNLTIEALNSVPSDEWAVVVAGHCPLWQEIGDREVMKGVLAAYKAKDTYSGEYAGTAGGGPAYTNLAEPLPNNTTDTSKWVNGYRFSSTAISAQSGKTLSNPISIEPGDVIRVKGVSFVASADRYWLAGLNVEGQTWSDIQYVSSGGSTQVSITQDGDVYVFNFHPTINGLTNVTARFAFNTPSDPNSVIITVNEEIKESAHGYDYVSVDCDFSNAKGKLVGYFAGHNHADNAVVQYGAQTDSEHGFPCITTRCDAKEEYTDEMKAERVEGTTTEQCFDVFTVNKKTGTISATKIGAGADRTISY